MASSSARTSPDKQRRMDGSSRRPSPVQASKSGKSEFVSPMALPKAVSQFSSEQPNVKVKNNVNTDIHGSVNSLASEVGAKLAIGDLKEPLANGINSSGIGTEQEKKIPEHGVSLGLAKVSDGNGKTSVSAKTSDRIEFAESGKSSMCRGSTCSDLSDESSCSSFSSSINKPHKANDHKWEAIQAVRAKDGVLGLTHFRLLKKLGCGDIGSVYLSELSGTKCFFAMKVMDKGSLASRKKLLRAQTEREILQSLDHPFLPSLYTHFETEKFSCLVMEFCPGGDLHTLRQRQPGKHFSEQAVKYDALFKTYFIYNMPNFECFLI